MDQVFDLFGDPVPEGWGKRGRPAHIATQQNRNKVTMLLALGWSNQRIAAALGITQPTLRKNYFQQLKFRDEQRDRLDAALAMKLWDQVDAGNVAAMKEFRALIERNDLMLYGQTNPTAEAREAVADKPLGKKEQAAIAAKNPGEGTPLGELIARRKSGVDLN